MARQGLRDGPAMALAADAARGSVAQHLGMLVISHGALPHDPPGHPARRLQVAGRAQGITEFEVWTQQLDPGACTEPRRHAGTLAILALQGSGKLLLPGGPQRFQAPCTLIVPAGAEHHLVNHGGTVLQLVGVAAPPNEVAPC